MSLFKKFFGQVKARLQAVRKVRALRIDINPNHKVRFEVFGENAARMLPVQNISTTGMGFKKDQDTSCQALGTKLTGQVSIARREFRATLEVRHITTETVGCQIISSDENLERAIHDYLIAEATGIGLLPVREDLLKEEPDGTPQWFVDGAGNELYFVEKNGAVQRLHMSFLGHYVEWKAGGKPQIGYVVSDRRGDLVPYKDSHMVKFVDNPAREIGLVIERVLGSIVALDPKMKIEITRVLSGTVEFR